MTKSGFDEIAERLKLALGITSDAALAKALGMKPTAYNNRKLARSVPLEAIFDLCAREGISMDSVLGLEGGKKAIGEVLTKDEKELVEAYRGLDKEDRKAVKRHASSLSRIN